MTAMNKKIALGVRVDSCTRCKMHNGASDICVTATGPKKANVLVVGKMPNSSKYQAALAADLLEAGIDPTTCAFTQAIKCRNFDEDPGRGDVKACKPYLDEEIALIKPKWVLALGNEALSATTGHSGIMKYRGKLVDRGAYQVFPTISPASVTRNPGQRPAYIGELRYFAAQVNGVRAKVQPPRIIIVNTKKKVQQLANSLDKAELLSYDVETTGLDEFSGKIVSLAGTHVIAGRRFVWALPLYHPESPFRTSWRSVLKFLAPHLIKPPKLVAHNGKFDARWLRQFGVPIGVTFDTMLACHILDENQQKGLKPQAAARLGVQAWAINTGDLITTPLDEVLKYNALDTYYTYHIYLQLRKELIEEPRLLRIFRFITMRANEVLIDVERNGIWIDREKLATNTKIANDMRADIDRKLMKYVPKPKKVNWPVLGKGKPAVVNFNPSNFSRWWLFDHLGLPVLERGKPKDDGSPGNPSMREAVLLELKGTHPVIELLLERSMWQKYCSSFLGTYDKIADENDRIHTTFKLAGTVTGRLSSGKADEEKVTARRDRGRGINLQQVPRDIFIRGMFGAPPGRAFVEADFSQIELRIAAFLSRDPTMLHLYQTGQDIHRATAAWVLGVPESQVTGADRKKAKAVNFGFVYGMGAPKFVATAFEKYELVFSLDEAKAIRRAFFEQFSGLLGWHARCRRLVAYNHRAQSPIGRVRHLPDILSEDQGVRAEAERQAINSPVQGFGSDMCQLSMVEIDKLIKAQDIDAHTIGTVHDSLMFEVAVKDLKRALPLIKGTMENLPLQRLFGLSIDVPIIADIKVGRYWGGATELSADDVWDWKGKIDFE
jgi:DNA polymerase-1